MSEAEVMWRFGGGGDVAGAGGVVIVAEAHRSEYGVAAPNHAERLANQVALLVERLNFGRCRTRDTRPGLAPSTRDHCLRQRQSGPWSAGCLGVPSP